ncbi:MAG TPA: hypothetical protein PLV91_06635, partial [Verrucomicrobiota bacterium]|nr:hypothetical protein [Verrucomicrobiota bacterium]
TAQHVEAVFDVNSLELGLARWEAIYAYSTGQEQKIKTINLSVSNNVPVVWEPSPAQEDRNSRSNRVRGVRSTGGR